MKILRAIGLLLVGVFIYLSLSTFFSRKYTTERIFSETNLLYRSFPLQLAVITREYSYVKKWVDSGFWARERFIAINGRVTVGFDLTRMDVKVKKSASITEVVVTVNPPKVLSLEIGDIYDPTSVMGYPAVWDRIINEARKYFVANALRPENTLPAIEEFKALVRRTVENVFPEKCTVTVRFRELR